MKILFLLFRHATSSIKSSIFLLRLKVHWLACVTLCLLGVVCSSETGFSKASAVQGVDESLGCSSCAQY